MTNIHATAIIDKNANIADNVTIGPFCIVDANVSIAKSKYKYNIS